MGLFLGIDGGGTKTRCVFGDETRVLARAATGTVKLMRVSEAEASARIEAMLAEAAAAAGVSLGDVTRTCVGLAGVTIPAVQTWAHRTLSATVSGEVVLLGDEEIALDAAFGDGQGILVIAGTGSNAIGRTVGGEVFGAGGWGPVLGDEGSGFWIGLEAVRAVLMSEQGLDGPSMLLKKILQEWRLGSVPDLVALGNQRTTGAAPDFAELAPAVAGCAELGDAQAAAILQQAGEELAKLVASVSRKMRTAAQQGSEADIVRVAFTGSVLAEIPRVRQAMADKLSVSVPAACVEDAAVDPLDGALWRARKA